MKYFVFTEGQMERALLAWMMRRSADGIRDSADLKVREFFESPEAREYKLLGGASYNSEPSA